MCFLMFSFIETSLIMVPSVEASIFLEPVSLLVKAAVLSVHIVAQTISCPNQP